MGSPGSENMGVWEEMASPPTHVGSGPPRMPTATLDITLSPAEGGRGWQSGRSCSHPDDHHIKQWDTQPREG